MGRRGRVRLRAGTRLAALYRAAEVEESYYCSYGVNPGWVGRLEAGGLSVCAVGEEGEVRAVELPGHPFFVATLFVPQALSTAAAPHPVLLGLAQAARARQAGAPSAPGKAFTQA